MYLLCVQDNSSGIVDEKTLLAFNISFIKSLYVFLSGQFEYGSTNNNINDILPQVYNTSLSNYYMYGNRANSDGKGKNGSGYLFIGI